MKINELKKDTPIFSLEIFPPKKTDGIDTIYNTLEQLKGVYPDFISVTFGAGGSVNNSTTVRIAHDIKTKYGIESVAHMPCIYLTKSDAAKMLDELKANGIENILALRGDLNPDIPAIGDFEYASDLVKFINVYGGFNVIGACYPETHLEASSSAEDIKNLKYKVDCGCNELISQLFFDNNFFYSFLEKCDIAGINVPVEAGIMPVTKKKQIERMTKMCGATLPDKFRKVLDRYEFNDDALRDAGIAYAIDQITDLIANGVSGIHLYTMNDPYVAGRIYEAVKNILKA
ncbi:MAG: methylenetetrahydrofolate reductase [NAD(P)H] [Ruminococcus sp.]|nr:methylenetetrahydrofolate reductase [NAD(P)H] [Ruminococcus sp.]